MGEIAENLEPHLRNVSTGSLPDAAVIVGLLDDAHARFTGVTDGTVADYIEILGDADPALFGICVAGAAGRMYAVGDATVPFSIQSISKAFMFALVCEHLGADAARAKLGVNATGLPFNSIMAIELSDDRTLNPMVNAGAIATTSLVPGATTEDKWSFMLEGLSRFAGRPLSLDRAVYESESADNLRNQGAAHLMDSYGSVYCDPDEATDLYTKQCSLSVTAEDLAVMASTLADGGTNPQTEDRVVSPEVCRHVLAVMATNGMYEHSGDWLYDVGLPGKSGVSGGMVTVAPGKGGVAVYSPPLDEAGNSVRGRLVTHFLSEQLGLNLFSSIPLV